MKSLGYINKFLEKDKISEELFIVKVFGIF